MKRAEESILSRDYKKHIQVYSMSNERIDRKYRNLKEDEMSGNDEESIHKGGGIWAGH